ncbi:hypothetical protein [Psychroserpens luteus]|uniref:Uncharacterized protein n=1 Tax=Psychroserpens luteus TaxID=1434066 RepID=A0ABW5ZZG2_9FLAO|nr:hypothetical protein [Psychroserpens luteus]
MYKKKPYWYRYLRYGLNCILYRLLFPVGTESDDFGKQWRKD